MNTTPLSNLNLPTALIAVAFSLVVEFVQKARLNRRQVQVAVVKNSK